ncbi:MAG: glycosyltransferase [Armatimonadetes bacterium]|nr:glycosyltransferase [Armatimonadota bacterium]
MSCPRVSVVIPAYNSWPLLEICLRKLGEQTLPHDQYEVIVVDDAGSDKTSTEVEQLARRVGFSMRCIRHQVNAGPGAARNTGIQASSAEVVALVDADTEPYSTWLEEGLKAIEGFDVAEGYTEIGSEELITPFTHQTQNVSPGGFPTCNMFLRRSVFREVGLFDTRFYDPATRIHFREDTELALRIIERGLGITFAEHARVVHRPLSPSWKRPIRLAMRYRHDRLLRQLHPQICGEWHDVYEILGRRFKRLRQKLYWSYLGGLAAMGVLALSSLPVWPAAVWTVGCFLAIWGLHVRAMGRRAISLQGLTAAPLAAVVPFVFAWSVAAGVRLHPSSQRGGRSTERSEAT